MTTPRAIRMIAFNPLRRKYEEVFPEDEVTLDEMRPCFYCRDLGAYVSIPGYSAADVYDEWLDERRKD